MIEDSKLFFGLPIKLDDNTCIYQPTLKQILESDLQVEQLIEPLITLDKRNFQEEENDNITNFDMFFIQIFMGYLDTLQKEEEPITIEQWIDKEASKLVVTRLIKVLKFLCRTEDIELFLSENILDDLKENYILINKSYKIDRSTFEFIKSTICEIFDTEINIEKPRERTEEEKKMDSLFERKRKEYEKAYGKENKRKKNKENLTIFTLVNFIVNKKNSQYSYSSIQELTIFQIKNTFKYYQSQEAYEMDLMYRTSGNFKMDTKNTSHWFFDK